MKGEAMRLVVLGAGGRMGRMLVATVLDDPATTLHAALERPGSEWIGAEAGRLAGAENSDVVIGDDVSCALDGADGVLDFTTPSATLAMVRQTGERGLTHVIGTTGFSPAELEALQAHRGMARIVRSGNMSLGVNLLAGLVRKAAAALEPEWDIEVLEMHHRMKVDAPSGTALLLGEAAAEGRGITLRHHAVRSRDGQTGARRAGDIGFATLRGGSVVGEHTVIFAGAGERIELSHRAEDRGLFARGALRAALWAQDRQPGMYSMADVLGLTD
jgi:4-hydroxy-tetrahydrodipicolinate reductase